MKKQLLSILFCGATLTTIAQSNPTPFNLSNGTYSLNSWDSLANAGTYPTNAVFQTYAYRAAYSGDPTTDTALVADWSCGYNIKSKSRINGLGADGISFVLTSSGGACTSPTTNGRPGALLVSINTTGINNVYVSWLAGAMVLGDGTTIKREYALGLFYRVGHTGSYTAVPNTEYSSQGKTAGDVHSFSNIQLPSACANQPEVQLVWKYYAIPVASAAGTRPKLRLDDISISSSSTTALESYATSTNQIVLFPNPGNGLLTITSANTKLASVTIYDAIGKIVYAITGVNENSIQLSLQEQLLQGMYIIETTDSKNKKRHFRYSVNE